MGHRSNRMRGTVLAAIAAAGVVACGPDTQTPLQVEPALSAVASESTGVPWVSRVTGGGTARFPTGVIQSAHAEATRWADGSASGTFSSHARVPAGQNQLPIDFEWEFDVALDCLVVDGDQAWMSGKVVRMKKVDTPYPFALDVGSDFMFITADRFADPSVPPGVYGPAAAFGTANCADKPVGPPLPPGVILDGGFTILSP